MSWSICQACGERWCAECGCHWADCGCDMDEQEETTMTTKHTPGPWYAVAVPESGPYAAHWQVQGDPTTCRSLGPISIVRSALRKDAREADALLIAAAPDLLAALRDLETMAVAAAGCISIYRASWRHRESLVLAVEAARAAIAKAEGGTR